jgi:hypothetical protein
LDDLTDCEVGAYTQGHVLVGDGSDSYDNGFLDSTYVTYTPGDADDWPLGDPGDVDNALDSLMDYLSPLLPSAAPVLDNIGWSSSEGVEGQNTWNDANPIAGYASADTAGSVNNAGDAVDVLMTTTGNNHGVMDYDTVGDKTGPLNGDVDAGDNYPADAFSPGGSDGGSVNNLVLKLNGSTLQTCDLLTFGSGDSVNGNGSGFKNLIAATPVYFVGGAPFSALTYRTGDWYVDTADMVKGYNVITVEHTTDAGTQTTNVQEFILDDEDTVATYASESITGYPTGGSTKQLSGVTYDSGTIQATYNCTISNAYRNTYKGDDCTGYGVNYTGTNCTISDQDFDDSGGNEAKQFTCARTLTVSQTRMIGTNLSVTVKAERTVQSEPSSSGATVTECLVDRASATSNNSYNGFDDENYRIQGSGNDFDDDLSSDWDESQSLVGASAGHNEGAQVINSRLDYPAIDFSSYANAPGGNPDYSSASGVRYFFGYFYNASGYSNFSISLLGSGTLVNEGTLSTGTDEVSVAIRLPSDSATGTGWMDIHQDYSPGSWGSVSEAYDAAATVGCYSASYGTGDDVGDSDIGCTVGTKSTNDSFGKIYYRISVPQGWTGYLTSISISWGD